MGAVRHTQRRGERDIAYSDSPAASRAASRSAKIRLRNRGGVPSFYALLRLPDGSRPQRRLGRAWLRRSRPPEGYITRAQAEARLEAILAGDDHRVQVVPACGITFKDAAEEWLRYVEHDRKRECSTVLGYRRAVESRLLPAFGHLALEDIDADAAERWRAGLIREGLGAATVNKLRWKCEAIFKRAQRVWPITDNPFANLERQPYRPSGDFNILSPEEIAALIHNAANDQDAALFAVGGYAGLRLGELRPSSRRREVVTELGWNGAGAWPAPGSRDSS